MQRNGILKHPWLLNFDARFIMLPHLAAACRLQDAADLLFSAFRQAHLEIVQQTTTGLTTLCVGLLLPIYLPERRHNQQSGRKISCDQDASRQLFALVVASVGDSQAFVLREGHRDAVEVTGWVPQHNGGEPATMNHEENAPPERDFRDAGGALGAVHKGSGEPELQNLMCVGKE